MRGTKVYVYYLGMPMVCRLQSGNGGSGRPRSTMGMTTGDYTGRSLDPYQSEPLFNTGLPHSGGFY